MMLANRKLTRQDERRRTQKAVELAAEGWSYDEIAVQLGYASDNGPRMAVMRHLQKSLRSNAETVFKQIVGRLDRALLAIMPLVDEGDTDAINTMLKIEAQRARYYGIDKGTVMEEDKAAAKKAAARAGKAYDETENAQILKTLAESGGLATLLPEGVPAAALFLPDGVIYEDDDIPEGTDDPEVIDALAAEFRVTQLGQVEVLEPGSRW